jgi:integrase
MNLGAVFPHRFRHHFSHTWLDRGGTEGDLMELDGWTSPQMLRRYGASARSARARRSYDRIMDDAPLPAPAKRRRSRHPRTGEIPADLDAPAGGSVRGQPLP